VGYLLFPTYHFYNFRSRSHIPGVSSDQLQKNKPAQESRYYQARSELQGVNAVRVLRLAGAAPSVDGGSSVVVLRNIWSHCHVSMNFTKGAKGFCNILLILQRKFSSEFLK